MLGAHEAAACRKAAASEAALLPIAIRGSTAFARLLRCECADAEARCEELNNLARWAEVLRQPGGGSSGAAPSSSSAEIAACRRRAQRVAVAQAEACQRPGRLEACVAVLLLALDTTVDDDDDDGSGGSGGGEAAAAASALVAAYVAEAAGRAAKERREGGGGGAQELRPLTLPRVEHSVLKALCRNEDGSTLLALQLAAVSRACLAGVCPLLRPLVLGAPPDMPADDAALACTFLIETAAVAAGKPASWADVLKGLAGWGTGGVPAAAAAAAPRPPQSLEVLSALLRSVRSRGGGGAAAEGDAEPASAAAVGFPLFQESLLVRPLPRPPPPPPPAGDEGGASAEDVCLARWVRVCLDAAAEADEGGGSGDAVCWASSDGIRELFTAGDFNFTASALSPSSPSPLSLSQHAERESAFVELAPAAGVGLSGAWELRTPGGGRRHDMVLSGWPLGGGRGTARAYNVSIVGGAAAATSSADDEEDAAAGDCHGVLTPYDAPPCGDAYDGGGRIPFPAAAAAAEGGGGGGILSCVLPQYHAVMSDGGVVWAALPYEGSGAERAAVTHLDVYRHDSLALLCAGEGRVTRFDAVRCGSSGGTAAAASLSTEAAETLPPPYLEARHLLALLRAALLRRGDGGGGDRDDDGDVGGGFSPALCGAARSYLRCDMHGCLEGRLRGLLGRRPACLREMAEVAAGTGPVSAGDAARTPLWCVLRDVLELSAAEAAEALRAEIVSAQTPPPAADAVVCFAAAAAAGVEAGDPAAAAAAAAAIASLLRAGGETCGAQSPLRPLVPLQGFSGLLVGRLLGVLAPAVLCDAAAWEPEAAADEAVRAAAADVAAGDAPFLGFGSLKECVREVCRCEEEGAEAAALSEGVALCLHRTLAGLSLLVGSSGHACAPSVSEEAAGAATRCVDRWVCAGAGQADAEEEEEAGGGVRFFGPLLLGYLRHRAAPADNGGASVAFDVSLVTGSAAVAASAEAQAYLSAQVAEAQALRRRVFPAAAAAATAAAREGLSAAAPLDATLVDLRRCASEGVVLARNARCGGGGGATPAPLTAEEAAAAAEEGQAVLAACVPLFEEAEGRLRRVRRLLEALEGRGWIEGAGLMLPRPTPHPAETTLRALRTEAEEWETGVFGRCRVFAGLSPSVAVAAAACTPEEALRSPILRGWWASVDAEGGAAVAGVTAAEQRATVSRVCDALERALAVRVQEVAGSDRGVSVAQALGLSADGGTAVAVAASDAAAEARVLQAAGVGEVGRRRVLAGRRLVKRTLALGGLFP